MESNEHTLLPASVDREDVQQEAEIVKLEGKTPHRGLIRRRLLNKMPELSFSEWLPSDASPLPKGPTPLEADDYQKLTQYLFSCGAPGIEQAALEFLEDPNDEDKLDILLNILYDAGYITKRAYRNTRPSSRSLREIVYAFIYNYGPVHRSEIYAHVSSLHSSRRPAAAARQAMRELIREDKIKGDDDDLYIVHN